MVRDIKAMFALKKTDELYNLIIVFGSAIFALIINWLTSSDEDVSISLGRWLIGFVAGGYVSINMFIKFFMISDEIPRGLTFGMTRKKMFIHMRIYDALEIIVISILALIILGISSFGMVAKLAVIAFGFFTLLSGVVGNSIVRYGKTAYWVYYILFLVICFGTPRLIHLFPAFGDFLASTVDHITNPVYSQGPIWIGILVFVAISGFISWLTFRKIAVNSNV